MKPGTLFVLFSLFLCLTIIVERVFIPSLILSDGNQKVMGIVATSSPPPTTQQSSFRSKALPQVYSVEVGLQPRKTGLTTICYSVVVAHALIGHGRRCVIVIEVVGNATRIAWSKHSLMTLYFTQLAWFAFPSLSDWISLTIAPDRIYTTI